jgi:membrane protease YdiL (CAAX protease family)
MSMLQRLFLDAETSRLRPVWRGHLFLFDRPIAPTYNSRDGIKLLFVFAFLEGIAKPLLDSGSHKLAIDHRVWWSLLQLSVLTVLACWLVVGFTRVRLRDLGLAPWRMWSRTERLYLLQTVPITIAVFSFVQFASLKTMWTRTHLWEIGLFVFVPKMIWGGYQELLYRGILQTELVRRWGTLPGVLLSNVIFTFGPLHAYHFRAAQTHPAHLWIFAAIFSIGLFFALIFHRSGNLWIVAIMHGLGDWFIDGLAQVSRMAR